MMAILNYLAAHIAYLLFGVVVLIVIARVVMVVGDLVRFVRSLHKTDDEPGWITGEERE